MYPGFTLTNIEFTQLVLVVFEQRKHTVPINKDLFFFNELLINKEKKNEQF